MRYVVRKLVIFVLTLWVALTLNFLIPRLMPGNPAQAALAKLAARGPVSPTELHAIELTLGLPHGSLLAQYGGYLLALAHGHLGISYTFFPESVRTLIAQALPWTLGLVGTTTVLAFVVGTLLGVLSAWRRGGVIDTIATVGSTFTAAFPYFWTALLALYLLGFVLGWFPIRGGYASTLSPSLSLGFMVDAAYHAVLPAATILVSSLGGWLLGMRNTMIPTLGEDYVTFAEANGIPSRTVALRYAARNAILPNVTGFGLAAERDRFWSRARFRRLRVAVDGGRVRLSGGRVVAL